ncbi:putative RING-H2 finger protein ATL21A [Vigna unguiculata]|uniref:putative RING-H2 finger protein ATL21A n=1 Tax=Vigna unguiculata TaxID=3917 RepID=UPI001016CDAB|nr:putative RING-H2 finger protein ATL21A [Vigna unguiculata]
MNFLKLLFHCFIPFAVAYASSDCQYYSWCSDNNILIRFPFQIQGLQHPYCGYPGFQLTCSNDSKTVITLPYMGKFFVRNINYLRQEMQVYDPDDCLPKRLLSLNLSASPFIVTSLRNYTLFSCPTPHTGSQFIPIDCLSNSTSFVSAIPSLNFTTSLPDSCHVLKKLSFPVAYQQNFSDDLLSGDLLLTWSSPDCRYCESQQALCGFQSINSDQVSCFFDYQTGGAEHGLRVFGIITLSIVGPAIMCAIAMACYASFKYRRGNTARISAAQRSAPTEIAEAGTVRMGLDESTIESYQKLELGESRRVPGPNEGCCTICLSEYKTKDTIRCIPECAHCFHAHCIDEWLRINTTCPLCRNSPSAVLPVSTDH